MQTAHGYGSDETALIKAAKKGHIDVVRVLVDAGARIYGKESTEIISAYGPRTVRVYYDMFFDVTLGGVRSSVPAAEFIRMMVDITSTDIQETGLGDPPPRGGYGDRGYRGYDDRRSGGYSRDRYPDSRDGGGGGGSDRGRYPDSRFYDDRGGYGASSSGGGGGDGYGDPPPRGGYGDRGYRGGGYKVTSSAGAEEVVFAYPAGTREITLTSSEPLVTSSARLVTAATLRRVARAETRSEGAETTRGWGNFEDSGAGADLRCAPARAGAPARGRGQPRGWET